MTRTATKPKNTAPRKTTAKSGHTRGVATPAMVAQVRKAIAEETTPEAMAANIAYAEKADAAAKRGETLSVRVLNLLLAERHRQGLTLAELESRCGISRANLSKLWNLDEPNVTLGTVERLARAMRVAVTITVAPAAKGTK